MNSDQNPAYLLYMQLEVQIKLSVVGHSTRGDYTYYLVL